MSITRFYTIFYLIILIVFCCYCACHPVILLYPDGRIPFAKNGTEIPRLTVYAPVNAKKSGIAVIVCSGGSYYARANSTEGIPACKKLQEAGITAFLLDYRVPRADKMEHREIVPFIDAQSALQYVREHAKQYDLDEHKIGFMGFSAGAHLVAMVGTRSKELELPNTKSTSLRPDFMVLVYPVISFTDSLAQYDSRNNLIGPDISEAQKKIYSNELHVTDKTPPTYISVSLNDRIVKPANSLLFFAALKRHNVPVEIFIYKHGLHGYGIDNKLDKVQWIDGCITWMKTGFGLPYR